MEINLNMEAENSYDMFNISYERAHELINAIAEACAHARVNFQDQYEVFGVVPQTNGTGKLMSRIDVCKIVKRMIESADTEDEKNYVLYCAYTGIDKLERQIYNNE